MPWKQVESETDSEGERVLLCAEPECDGALQPPGYADAADGCRYELARGRWAQLRCATCGATRKLTARRRPVHLLKV